MPQYFEGNFINILIFYVFFSKQHQATLQGILFGTFAVVLVGSSPKFTKSFFKLKFCSLVRGLWVLIFTFILGSSFVKVIQELNHQRQYFEPLLKISEKLENFRNSAFLMSDVVSSFFPFSFTIYSSTFSYYPPQMTMSQYAHVFRSRDHVKIGDFGISKILSSKSKAFTVVGTPCYISPGR